MEYAENGDMLQYLKVKRRIDEEEAKIKFKQITEAVNYCHANEVLHRDIKLDNILINDCVLKLCDFGISRYMLDNQVVKN